VSSPEQQRCLVLFELNEVNFDVAREYAQSLGLRGFRTMFAGDVRATTSESRYEELEPWIQWVSAHSGLTAKQHGIFRLGDIVTSGVPQMFEQIEAQGLSVGAVSPMNTENRLTRPAYFLPDPWTQTHSDGSFWSRSLSRAISQAVNSNAEGRITLRSAVALWLGLMRFARPRHYGKYIRLAARSRNAPWRKALFLDLLIHDVHWALMHARRPHFSTIFLNAGAHIQHHYYFNCRAIARPELRNPEWYVSASEDPIAEMLQLYDALLCDYLDDPRCDLIVATGLTQVPYNRVKYYYRPRDHAELLRLFGVRFRSVAPRMTRDFLIEFQDDGDAAMAARQLAALTVSVDGLPLFGDIENRGTSLFVTLTYPNEIVDQSMVIGATEQIPLAKHVVFVAIKNGMHASNGYVYFGSNVERFAPEDGSHVSRLYSTVMRYFGVDMTAPRRVS
jgi:hypothetical protein